MAFNTTTDRLLDKLTKKIAALDLSIGTVTVNTSDLETLLSTGTGAKAGGSASSRPLGTVEGVQSENGNVAAAGYPVLVSGRYDSSPRTLSNERVGAIALNASGHVIVENTAMVTDLAALEVLSTAANVDLAAMEVLLTAIDADTNAIKTAVEILDNAISGNEMQVDVVASLPAGTNIIGSILGMANPLPAGTNAIGKLSANSGVDIGDVDVTSIVPGTGATNLGKAEDAAHSSGDVGVMPLAVRNDALATLGGADGDYAPLQVDATGSLYTNNQFGTFGSILVTGTTAVTCGVADRVFVAIYMLTNTVFNSASGGLVAETEQLYLDDTGAGTSIDADGGAAIDSITFPAGMTLYGRYTGFTLASGSVVAYVG
tara:strand:- start:1829 stop:2947 length:1119 start_codon:yes stop_codon:yes gene_type:complete